MAQFDVHRNANTRTSGDVPYLLDIQHDVLGNLNTRVVAPLLPASHFTAARHLNPTFTVEGRVVVMSTAELAGIPLTELGEKVANLERHRDEIVAAIDFLVTGI